MSARDAFDRQVSRFAADLRRLVEDEPTLDRPLALAVSGGSDSMAMLALAAAAFPGAVIAATVDHALREDSAAEAAMVAHWCQATGVPHATLPVSIPRVSGNLHDWARGQRYALLHGWADRGGALALLTAHHADDQAETFLMRAARGAGITGLSAIRERQEVAPPVPIDTPAAEARRLLLIRPLLDWRRAELAGVAADAGMPIADDPSNRDPRYRRTALRSWLAAAPDIDPLQLARAARQAAEVNDDFDRLDDLFWRERARDTAGRWQVDVADLPREMRRRLVRRGLVIADLSGRHPAAIAADVADANIEPLLDALEAGRAATQGDVLVRPIGTLWRFSQAPPRRSH